MLPATFRSHSWVSNIHRDALPGVLVFFVWFSALSCTVAALSIDNTSSITFEVDSTLTPPSAKGKNSATAALNFSWYLFREWQPMLTTTLQQMLKRFSEWYIYWVFTWAVLLPTFLHNMPPTTPPLHVRIRIYNCIIYLWYLLGITIRNDYIDPFQQRITK